jgi:hypothetical protein
MRAALATGTALYIRWLEAAVKESLDELLEPFASVVNIIGKRWKHPVPHMGVHDAGVFRQTLLATRQAGSPRPDGEVVTDFVTA